MKRRISACLLMLCMILSLVPMLGVTVGAEDGVVATVTYEGKILASATTLSEAFTAAGRREGSTVKLESDVVITAGFDFNGTYTFDLNGYVITAHTPLIQTAGTVTIIDTSSAKTGTIRGLGRPALELRGTATEQEDGTFVRTGNIILKSGTFDATDCDYAVYNKGQGVLYLTGAPKLEKGIYISFSGTLCGNDGAEGKAMPYEGEVIPVYYAEDPIPENAVLLTGGNTEKFEFAQRGYYTPQAIGNTYVYSQWGYISVAIVILVAVVICILLLIMFSYMRKVSKKIKNMNSAFAIPAFLPFMAAMGDTWRLVLLIMAALLVIAIVLFIVMMILSKKKLKKATKAYQKRLEEDPEFAARKAEEFENSKEGKKQRAKEEKKAAKAAKKAAKKGEEAEETEEPAEVIVEEEAPAEEPTEEVVEEAPAEEPAEEVVEEAPAEEPAEEVVEEVPAEEPAEEVVEEAPAEEPAEEVVEEAPAEEPAEEVVEEAPAEEPAEEVVEEAPAEEPAEEVVEEEAGEEDEVEAEEEADEVKIERQPNVLVSVPVIGADGKATSYTTYKKSFMARIVLSSAEVQERYNVMKNALLSYKKVNARISWSYESIKSARTQLAKFAIRGKTLCMYLALDPKALGDSKYNVSDESESKKYDTVPCCLRLTSKRSIKWGLELIEKMAAELGLEANPKYQQTNYIPDAKSDEELLELGLIKKVQ